MKTLEPKDQRPPMTTKTLAPSLADFPQVTFEKLRFADTDRYGHITNSIVAVCCQTARMEILCDSKRVPILPTTQFVIAKLLLEFRAEMHWPGSVQIGTRVERVGRSSVTLAQGLFTHERCVATAESVVTLMDLVTRRSAPIPQAASQVLAQWHRGTATCQGTWPERREPAPISGE